MFGYRTLYFIGLIALLISDRILGLEHAIYLLVCLVGIGSLGTAAFLAHRRHQSILPALYIVLSIIGYALWWLGDLKGQQLMSIEEDSLLKWNVFFQSIGAIFFAASILPTLALHQLFALGSKHVSNFKLQKQALLWTGTTLLLVSLFPINYLAHERNVRWDLGYFKTATPGESSISLIENLSEPVTVYLFFQMGMDVTDEIRTYFDAVPADKLDIRYVDKDVEPALAKELSVQNNGMIILSTGEGDNRSIERINIGKTLSAAKRKLKKLDEEFREALLTLTKEPSVLYLTTGHGELYWKVQEDEDSSRKISLLKRGLSASNFTIKELSIANGLANEIPEDAAGVVILAPQMEFSEAEVNTLLQFWNAGNSLFIALEPDGANLSPLLNELQVKFDPTSLAHGSRYLAPNRALPIHKRNLITNKFSTHASVTTLSRYNKVMALVFEDAGSINKIDGDTKVTTIIKSLEETWKDSNGNLQQDDSEATALWSLGVAVEQNQNDVESKAVVFSDASWLTDNYLGKGLNIGQQTIQPHAILLSDTLFWLTDQKDSAGTVNNELDVKIQHSKEGQSWIFFGTGILFPFFVFGIGRLRISNRTRGGTQ